MYWLIKHLIQPLPVLLLLCGLGIVVLWVKRPISTKTLMVVTAPFCALVLLYLPLTSHVAQCTLESRYPPMATRPPSVQAIVVLSAGVLGPVGSRRQPGLRERTLHRCLHAARVYREGPPCIVVTSGGDTDGTMLGSPAAAVMRDFLVEIGVPEGQVLTEEQSQTTHENALETAALLAGHGINEIVLVTDAVHLPRATRCFRRQGLRVVPCGCRYRTTGIRASLALILPNARAAQGIQEAWHEWVGLLWYRIRGRI